MDYVHGYSAHEGTRLSDRATTLTELPHADTHYPDRSRVLEAGCGVGAQTVILAQQSPGTVFTSIDVSAESLAQAEKAVVTAGFDNVTFRQADIFDLPFESDAFDHVFVCFVLEHLADPGGALRALARVLKPGGTMTVIEGDPRLGVLPSAERLCPPSYRLPRRAATTGRRRRADRAAALPASSGGRIP